MPRSRHPRLLGGLETRIMKHVWSTGRATVHDVRRAITGKRKLAYTTVLTTLQNLEKKGFLTHETKGRSYVYVPLVDEGSVARRTVLELLDRLFDGSRARLVNALFDDEHLTEEQFERLRRKILELRSKESGDG